MSRRAGAAPLDLSVVAGVAAVFASLAEVTRLRIVEQLRGGPLRVGELVDRLGARQANVSKQLGVLFEAGLLARERDGAQVRYSIAEPLVIDLCDAVCSKLRRDAEARVAAFGGVVEARPAGKSRPVAGRKATAKDKRRRKR